MLFKYILFMSGKVTVLRSET